MILSQQFGLYSGRSSDVVACGFIMLFVFGAAFVQTCRQKIEQKPWILKAALFSIPLTLDCDRSGVGSLLNLVVKLQAVGELTCWNAAASASAPLNKLWTSLFAILALKGQCS
ncbi:hypothetical protein O9992_02270 [Vibrio lentus]|nr:hypothetical protein [Vibrio lentus]